METPAVVCVASTSAWEPCRMGGNGQQTDRANAQRRWSCRVQRVTNKHVRGTAEQIEHANRKQQGPRCIRRRGQWQRQRRGCGGAGREARKGVHNNNRVVSTLEVDNAVVVLAKEFLPLCLVSG